MASHSGTNTPSDLIAYLKGLEDKEEDAGITPSKILYYLRYQPALLRWENHTLSFEGHRLAANVAQRYPIVLASGDDYPSPSVQTTPFLRLLEGRTDTDGRYLLTLMCVKYGPPKDFDMTEFTNRVQLDLRRSGMVYDIQTSVAAVDLNQNIALATTQGRQRPKTKLTATLIRFKLV